MRVRGTSGSRVAGGWFALVNSIRAVIVTFQNIDMLYDSFKDAAKEAAREAARDSAKEVAMDRVTNRATNRERRSCQSDFSARGTVLNHVSRLDWSRQFNGHLSDSLRVTWFGMLTENDTNTI